MNHIYRVIWSRVRHAFVVVSELAGRAGGPARTRASQRISHHAFRLGAVATALFMGSAFANGVVEVAGGNTQVYNAPNGVQIVDIATANGAGVSHNRFLQYNVGPNGQVLNNNSVLSKAGPLQSQLAGQVMANMNLGAEAKIILNEVVAANRSSLQGYTEVVGGKADVIVANPYGITCAGCGFINTDRALLTTGVPVFGANGALSRFEVRGGDIRVEGNGLDASRQNLLSLVARSIHVDARANARDLELVAGGNDYDYAARTATAVALQDDAPLYAIDSTLLGGMYANRIRLIATEHGVGVRMRGEAAASAEDFTLDAAGRIELAGKLSAGRDLRLSQRGTTGVDTIDVASADAELTAGRDLRIDADTGGLKLGLGRLTAERDLTLDVASLLDAGTAEATRYAGRDLRLSASGDGAIDGSVWGAGHDLDLRAASLDVDGGARLYAGGAEGSTGALALRATGGDLSLGTTRLQAPGRMQLDAAGALTTAAATQLQSLGDIALGAGGDLRHAGELLSARAATLEAGGLLSVTEQGRLQAGTSLSLSATDDLQLDGELRAGGTLTAITDENLHLAESASIDSGGDVRLEAQDMALAGTLRTAADLAVQAQGALDIAASSLLAAAGQVQLQADAALRHAGTLQSGSAARLQSGATLETLAGSSIQSGGDARLLAQEDLTHRGSLRAAGDVELHASDAALDVLDGSLIEAAGDASLRAMGGIEHAGVLRAEGDVGLQAEDGHIVVADSGVLESEGALSIDAAATLLHSGRIESAAAVTLAALGEMQLQAGSTLRAQGPVAVEAGNGLVVAGQLQSGQTLGLSSGADLRLAATAGVQAQDAIDAEAQGDLSLEGELRGTDAVSLAAGHDLDVAAEGLLHAGGAVALSAGSVLTHLGTLETAAAATLAARSIDTGAGSTLAAGTGLTLQARDHLRHAGSAQAVQTLRVSVTDGDLETVADSRLHAGGDYEVEVAGDFGHDGTLIGGGDGSIEVGGTFDNRWITHAAGDLQVQADRILNAQTAGLSALGRLGLNATGTGIENDGALYAGERLELSALAGDILNRRSGTLDASGGFGSSSARFINYGAVTILGNASIKTTVSFENRTVDSQGRPLTKRLGHAGSWKEYGRVKIANEGSLDSGMNAWLHDEEFVVDEHYAWLSNEEVQALTKAQIIVTGAGSRLDIDYGESGLNSGGIISAPTLDIGGTGTFINEDLTLYRYTKVLRWIQIDDEKSGRDDWYSYWVRIDPNRDCYDGAPAGCSGMDHDIPNSPDDDRYNLEDNNWSPGWGWRQGPIIQSGDSFPASLAVKARGEAQEGAVTSKVEEIASSGAGIFANDFTFSRGTLRNEGSPWPSDAQKAVRGGAAGGSIDGGGVDLPTLSVGGPTVGQAPTISVRVGVDVTVQPSLPLGFELKLPDNPNGYFVPSKDPSARYLVETNPLFAVGSNYLGSDYLAQRYGYDPDEVQKRLGDANYEAYLVRQQLIQQTGSNLIRGQQNEAAQIQQLMDNAYAQGQQMGLEFGKALTTEQAASLSQDIVWMESTVVNGESVLVPRVYLAATTVAALTGGAVIGADNVNIAGDGLQNVGGTIEGRETLTVDTTGDIRNTSGTLRGGDVSLTSSEGSIVNETLAETAGDGMTRVTAIGKTAGIEATGDLAIDAANNVEVIGAKVGAGGDASIAAGEDIVVDTIVDAQARTSYEEEQRTFGSSYTRTNVASETHIGSELDVGGNLKLSSGGDTVVGGSQVRAGGDLEVDTGGDLRIEARQDRLTVETQQHESGFGVAGGIYGSRTETETDFTGTNVGSTLEAGGNADIRTAGRTTIQGSDVRIDGDARIDATEGIAVLDGLDQRRTDTRVETTAIFKVGGSAGADAQASAEGTAAEASAGAEASGDVRFWERSVTTTHSGSDTSVGSTLDVGGNLEMRSDGDVTLRGSEVSSGGDLSVDAQRIDVLAGRNESWRESQTDTQSVGIYNEASAGASASASADLTSVGASAEVGAETTTTIGTRIEAERSSEYSLSHTGSSLRSGGDMDLKARDTATFQGAEVSSGGDMNIEARDIRNLAAQDIERSSAESSQHTAGIYFGSEASAGAEVGGALGNEPPDAKVGASTEVSAGLRYAYEEASEASGSVTNVTSSFTSGGNFTRTAEDSIVDQGTQVKAGGDITQQARTIRDEAIHDQTYSSSDAQSHDARVGVYAGASAEVSATEGSDVGAGVGGKASYEGSIESESERESTAVTSRFESGGRIRSTSTDETVLIGAQFKAADGIDVEAGSLDIQAARDTASASSHSTDINVEVKVGVAQVGAEAGVDTEHAWESSDTARTATFESGGDIRFTARDDIAIEGADLTSGGDIELDAGGRVDLREAQSTSSSSGFALGVSASAEKERGGGDGKDAGGSAPAATPPADKSGGNAGNADAAKADDGDSLSGGVGFGMSSESQTQQKGTALDAGGTVRIRQGEGASDATPSGRGDETRSLDAARLDAVREQQTAIRQAALEERAQVRSELVGNKAVPATASGPVRAPAAAQGATAQDGATQDGTKTVQGASVLATVGAGGSAVSFERGSQLLGVGAAEAESAQAQQAAARQAALEEREQARSELRGSLVPPEPETDEMRPAIVSGPIRVGGSRPSGAGDMINTTPSDPRSAPDESALRDAARALKESARP